MKTSDKNHNRTVAVVGAGAAGLCAARHFSAAGFDVTVFEIGTKVGGMWCFNNDSGLSPAYRTLHINTSRNVTRFRDLDFDESVQFFPDHADMYHYLCQYAEHFDLLSKIRFNSRVVDISPVNADGDRTDPVAALAEAGQNGWHVQIESGQVERFDIVIVASGHLSIPRHVDMFKNDFAGQYLHSSAYREPAEFANKRICIVGVGNSACDISGDLCAAAKRCVLVARTGVIVLPKLLFGLPFTDISSRLQKPWIPYFVRRRLILFLTWIAHGNIEKLGFKKPETRVHTTSNGTIINDVAYRRIEIKHGIDAINEKTIRFEDGTEEEFDVLIAATGYRIDLSFISKSLVSFEENQLKLYQRIVAPELKSMYFVGFFNTDTALMKIFEQQVKWILSVETGESQLPDVETMRDAVNERSGWVLSHYKDTERHRLEEESVPYLRSLRKSLKSMKVAARTSTG